MKFTYYTHATFSVEINGKKILFDPYFTGNPKADDFDIDKIKTDYLFISHGHIDHISDAVRIAKKTKAHVVCNNEVKKYLQSEGIEDIHDINCGASVSFDFGEVRAVNAVHSSGLPDGSYGGNPLGFVFTTSEGNFYFAGDTALTMDMQLIPMFTQLDFAVLPIGGHYTMGYKEAAIAAEFIKCDRIVGVHYNTFPLIEIDVNETQEWFRSKGKTLLLPAYGETINPVSQSE